MLDQPIVTTTKQPIETYFPKNDDIFFDVQTLPLYGKGESPDDYETYNQSNYYSADTLVGTFRKDTKTFLGGTFQTNGYTLVQNEDFFSPIEAQLYDYFNAETLGALRIRDHVAYAGSVVAREYMFPNLKHEITTTSGHKSEIIFRIIGRNCFDGSSKLVVYYGNIDMFCMNGMILGNFATHDAKRTSRFDLGNFINKVTTGIEQSEYAVNQLQEYAQLNTTIPYVREFFERLKVSDRQLERLEQQHLEEISVRGNNIWAVVSTLTNYASHVDGRFSTRSTKNDHESATIYNRQAQVAKWLARTDSKGNKIAGGFDLLVEKSKDLPLNRQHRVLA
jgi:hypothetical protein